jgi:hypothetical protein
MFYATTRDETYSFTLEKKSILVFERVVMNIGGHYNNIDGIFVAPKTGIYLFAWTVCTQGANYVLTELMVDNTMIFLQPPNVFSLSNSLTVYYNTHEG